MVIASSLQDSLNKEYTQKPSQERAAEILQEGHLALTHSHTKISLAYIEGVAKVRFALSVVAELFQKHVAMKPAFLHTVRKVCTDTSINQVNGTELGDKFGPLFYLLKLIARQFGFSCLAEVSAVHTWVVPPELKEQDEVIMTSKALTKNCRAIKLDSVFGIVFRSTPVVINPLNYICRLLIHL